tara:strand:+ start:393 stop:932 length:540 start_codon:yes stop_codon:yes gene_type:complete
MKFNNPIKSITILLPLCILILLNLNNQEESTKLKILIWETPSLSLGNYIAISTGAGFILSYILTSKLASYTLSKEILNYKVENKDNDPIINSEYNVENSYDNILIERDIKDPSPTINASFRVIGKKSTKKQPFKNIYSSEQNNSEFIDEPNYKFNNQDNNKNTVDSIENDWQDDTYVNW